MEDFRYLQYLMDDMVYLFDEDKEYFKEVELSMNLIEEEEEFEEVEVETEEEVVEQEVKAIEKKESKDPLKSHTSGIKYYGENKKNILVLLEYSGTDLLKAKEFDLLLKIMGAVNLTLHEFAIVNMYHHQELSFNELVQKFNPQKLLYFTATDESDLIEGEFEKYAPGTMMEIPTIISDSLTKLLLDVDKKKALWSALKIGFLNN